MDNELRTDIRQYLQFLQNTITRMGDYGKTCKQYSLGVLSIWFVFLGVLLEQNKFTLQLSIWVFVPILLFWFLDTFFLQTERKFRNKYNNYVQQYRNSLNKEEITNILINNLYDMTPNSSNKNTCLLKVLFSGTLSIMYGLQILLCVTVICIMSKGL